MGKSVLNGMAGKLLVRKIMDNFLDMIMKVVFLLVFSPFSSYFLVINSAVVVGDFRGRSHLAPQLGPDQAQGDFLAPGYWAGREDERQGPSMRYLDTPMINTGCQA